MLIIQGIMIKIMQYFSNNFKEKFEYINKEDNLVDDRVISSQNTDVNRSKNKIKIDFM